jgi:hypothetical protein
VISRKGLNGLLQKSVVVTNTFTLIPTNSVADFLLLALALVIANASLILAAVSFVLALI